MNFNEVEASALNILSKTVHILSFYRVTKLFSRNKPFLSRHQFQDQFQRTQLRKPQIRKA